MSTKSLLKLICASLPPFILCSLTHTTSPQFLRQWKQQPRVGLSRVVPKNLPVVRNVSNIFAISFKTETHDWVDNEENNAENVGRLVQLGWTSWDSSGNVLSTQEFCVKPQNFTISAKASRLHGITQQMALKTGQNRTQVLTTFCKAIGEVKANNGFLVTHMPEFDYWVVLKELRLYHPKETRLAHVFDAFNKVHTIDKRYLELHDPAAFGSAYWQRRSLGKSLLHTFEIFCERKVPDDYILSRSRMHSAAADAKMVGMVFFALRKRGYLGAVPLVAPALIPQRSSAKSSAGGAAPERKEATALQSTDTDTSCSHKRASAPSPPPLPPPPLPLPGLAAAEFVLAFGQYKGRTLAQTPASYLTWLVENRVYMSHPQLAIALMQLGYLSDPAAKVQGGYLDKLS